MLPQKLAAGMIGSFGVIGLILAVLGLHGVIAYHVAQRTREFGVRLALGASQHELVRMVTRRGIVLVAAGTVVGVIAALGVGRLASRFLYGVGAADPLTFAVVSAVLALVAGVAGYLPARRAGKVDPIISLRSD